MGYMKNPGLCFSSNSSLGGRGHVTSLIQTSLSLNVKCAEYRAPRGLWGTKGLKTELLLIWARGC